MEDRIKHFLSPFFISCLALLILNDFLLKENFHNTLTGKLSDFCGLFVFSIFWSAIFPKQKFLVFLSCGLLFIYWKSEYSTALIELCNTVVSIQRTVDYTDLMALLILPVAWFYMKEKYRLPVSRPILSRLGTCIIGMVAIFSFCATTQQRYIQSFDQPQYVLLRSAALPDSNSFPENFEFFKVESLLVVKVNQLYVSRSVRYDDYNKNRLIRDLDKNVSEMIGDSTKLIPSGKITSLKIKTSEGEDSMRFSGGRLDGQFTRSLGGKVLIEGLYKMGKEDSVWTFRDAGSDEVTKQTFINGERTNVSKFSKNKLVSTTSIRTRAAVIRNTYIVIGMLVLATSAVIVLLIRNYRKTFPEHLKIAIGWKLALCFISPIFILVTHFGIRVLLMDFNLDVFQVIASLFFIFLATCPLMFLIVFWIKLRKDYDILLYWLLFGLACSIWTTGLTAIELTNH